MLGNLLGDATRPVAIGEAVEAVFEPHQRGDLKYVLVQWHKATARSRSISEPASTKSGRDAHFERRGMNPTSRIAAARWVK